ncbi:protein of unknown function [Alcaligenes faecalis subsp. faecalis]|nr:protein of unknown function [Alcaligenes faecalis subsp. faecalis]
MLGLFLWLPPSRMPEAWLRQINRLHSERFVDLSGKTTAHAACKPSSLISNAYISHHAFQVCKQTFLVLEIPKRLRVQSNWGRHASL